MNTLPFDLYKTHRAVTKSAWKNRLDIDISNFDYWYNRYIYSSKCELCNKEYKSSKQRHLDHDHKTRQPRNVVCEPCNRRKRDVKQIKSQLGHKHIYFDGKRYIFTKYYGDKNKKSYSKNRTNLNKLLWIKFSHLILNYDKYYS